MSASIGDIFRDKDPRSAGRHLKAVEVSGLYARCLPCTSEGRELPGRRTRVSLEGLRTRFEKVSGSTLREDLERAALEALRAWREADKRFGAFEMPDSGPAACEELVRLKGEIATRRDALRAAADRLKEQEG